MLVWPYRHDPCGWAPQVKRNAWVKVQSCDSDLHDAANHVCSATSLLGTTYALSGSTQRLLENVLVVVGGTSDVLDDWTLTMTNDETIISGKSKTCVNDGMYLCQSTA